jgi:hypothetical protein
MRSCARRRALKVRKQIEQMRRALSTASEPTEGSREVTVVSFIV